MFFLSLFLMAPELSAGIRVDKTKITLDFAEKPGKYTIMRSNGRFSEYSVIGKTSKPVFTDRKANGSPY